MTPDPVEREPTTVEAVEPVEPLPPPSYPSRPLWTWWWTINVAFTLLLVFLIIRFLLKLFGAHWWAGFAVFVYSITEPFMGPFEGLFGTPTASTGAQFEANALWALAIYGLAWYGLWWIWEVYAARRWVRWRRVRRVSGPPEANL